MRRILFCLLAVFAFVSCEDNDPVRYPNDYPPATQWVNLQLDVFERDWKLHGRPDDPGSYYYAEFKVPELTSAIYKEGAVLMYIQSDPSQSGQKSAMPLIVYHIENSSSGEYFWTESFDFDYSPGWVTVSCKYSDFWTGDRGAPGKEVFYLVLIY